MPDLNPPTYGEQLARQAGIELAIDRTIEQLFSAVENDLIYPRTISWLAGRATAYVGAAHICDFVDNDTRDFWYEIVDAWEDFHHEQYKQKRGALDG